MTPKNPGTIRKHAQKSWSTSEKVHKITAHAHITTYANDPQEMSLMHSLEMNTCQYKVIELTTEFNSMHLVNSTFFRISKFFIQNMLSIIQIQLLSALFSTTNTYILYTSTYILYTSTYKHTLLMLLTVTSHDLETQSASF